MTEEHPMYADNGSATPVWEDEARRSQLWANEARIRAAQNQRRQMWTTVALGVLLMIVLVALVSFIAITIADAT